MFEQILDLVKQYAGESVVNNSAVPNEHNDAVMGEATKSISRGLQGLVAQGHSQEEIQSMFNSDGSANTPAAQGISANFMGSIMEKFGLSGNVAKTIAMALIPMVLSKIMGGGNSNTQGSQGNSGGGIFGNILGSLLGK